MAGPEGTVGCVVAVGGHADAIAPQLRPLHSARMCLRRAAPRRGFNRHTRGDVIAETSPGWHHTASSS